LQKGGVPHAPFLFGEREGRAGETARFASRRFFYVQLSALSGMIRTVRRFTVTVPQARGEVSICVHPTGQQVNTYET
jgi:hypothetical protein